MLCIVHNGRVLGRLVPSGRRVIFRGEINGREWYRDTDWLSAIPARLWQLGTLYYVQDYELGRLAEVCTWRRKLTPPVPARPSLATQRKARTEKARAEVTRALKKLRELDE